MKFLLAVTLPLYALDQATKWATLAADERGVLPHDVIPGYFSLVHWQNTGAAFSIGHGNNWFFVVLSFVALIGLVIAWRRGAFPDKPSRWGVALLLPGILGNLTDRIVHGHVVDFLLVDLHVRFANPWPAFNVADSCICIAVALFLISSFRPQKT
ncbi:MAG: signal peptidase II [Chthoniobacteraceae bacterium]